MAFYHNRTRFAAIVPWYLQGRRRGERLSQLEGFAGCGDFELGFVRTCCRSCGDELRVPFSCKSRGCCPSCMGRQMAEGAALLVDHVLPAVGYRQWMLSFPGPMAVRL